MKTLRNYALGLLSLALSLAAVAGAQSIKVEQRELVLNPPSDSKRSIVLIDNKVYGCPDGSEMFIRLSPGKANAKDSQPKDYKSLFGVAEGQMLRPDDTDRNFKAVCLVVR